MNIFTIKSAVVFSVALFFSIVAFNNLTDFESNRDIVMKVMTLDTVQNDNITWRSVMSSKVHLIVYWSFILWEAVTAAFCWVGAYSLFMRGIKKSALVGLTMGFLFYMIGFVDIASEWFYLWQSEMKSGQIKAILFSLLMLSCLYFVSSNANEKFCKHTSI